MLELSPSRKNKIHLADYNFQQDLANRMLLADFSAFEHKALEEILFSPLKISVKKLHRSLGGGEEELLDLLKKLSKTGLLSLDGDAIVVDKEGRKYFEFHLHRFDPSFKPDMEFLQGLLKKVPIHLLPSWYSIPRTSNNIFESIVEKYLLTPQIYQRYLQEVNFGDPLLHAIANDLFKAPDFKIASTDLISKYNLSRPHFEELMLLLEFNFVACLTYEKGEEEHWIEWVSPFHEWHEYLRFLKETETPPLPPSLSVERDRSSDFAFLEDLSTLLEHKKGLPTDPSLLAPLLGLPLTPSSEREKTERYLTRLIDRLLHLRLAEIEGETLRPLEGAADWLSTPHSKKAVQLYRHPASFLSSPLPEKQLREAEKSIRRVLKTGWVFFDEFLKGVLVPLSEKSQISLQKRQGKQWRYTLPSYGEEEHQILFKTIFEWLFELGIVATGKAQGRPCFMVTPFGKFFFEE